MDSEHPNQVNVEVTEQMAVIKADGFKFFRGVKSNDFQCATCLYVMGLVGLDEAPKINKNGIRRIQLQKGCDCPRQI